MNQKLVQIQTYLINLDIFSIFGVSKLNTAQRADIKKALEKRDVFVHKNIQDFPFFQSKFLCFEYSKSLAIWSYELKKLFNFYCAISGKPCHGLLHAHHLYSKSCYSGLKFFYLNGIPIHRDFHSLFHKMYGSNVTAEDFLQFLNFLVSTNYQGINKKSVHLLKNWIICIRPLLEEKL